MLHLPRHNRPPHAFPLKNLDQLRKLSQRHPVNRSSPAILDLRKRFFLDCNHDHVESRRPRRVQHKQGKRAVAGDKADTHSSGSDQWSVVSARLYWPLITDH